MNQDSKIKPSYCEGCIISQHVFSVQDKKKRLPSYSQVKHIVCADKALIYQQGDLPESVFSIRRGFIKLTQLNKDGEEKIVRMLGPGSCIGMEALLQQNYKQTAEALTEVHFCTIPVKMVIELVEQQPEVSKEIFKQCRQHLDIADDWLSQLYTGSINQRLCRFLLVQHKLQKMPDAQLLLISNQDIASVLATSDEAISRALSFLRCEGVLQRVDKRIYRLGIAAAEAIAAG